MDRRTVIGSAGCLLAASSAALTVPAMANGLDNCGRVQHPATFVLVHGASAGAFTLNPIAEILRAKGHRVFVPALTGVGERRHLLGRDVNLSTHVNDVSNIFAFEELEDVVLVGHSYGGGVVTCVADQLADKIRSLVFLDAFVGQDGKSIAELAQDTEAFQPRWDAGESGTLTDPNVPTMTPHPLASLLERMHLTGAWQQVAKKTYVRATLEDLPPLASSYAAVGDNWEYIEVDGSHVFPVTMPQRTADIIEAAI